MTELADTPVALLVCQRCGQVAMGLWADGDPCPNRRCGGRLAALATHDVAGATTGAPGENGHDGSGAALESTVPLLVPLPPSRDGEGAAEAPEAAEELLPPPDGDLLAGRAYAVRLARQVVHLLAACDSAWREAIEQRRLAGDDGPLAVRPWAPLARQERRRQADGLPLVDQDVVLARTVDGQLRLVPNGWAAQAKLALLDEEMGTRYDRKREVYIRL